MCGRFTLVANKKSLEKEFDVDASNVDPIELYNISPGSKISIIRNENAGKSLDFLLWGLIPFWAKDSKSSHGSINARSESIADKPTFRKPFQKQRCLIPASGFYEWDQGTKPKQPYYFHLRDKPLLAFAGIWDRWVSPEGEEIQSCCLITKTAADTLKTIHDRMPVVLPPDAYSSWLNCEDGDYFNSSVNNFEFYPVSTLLNSGREEGKQLIQPI